MNTPRTFTLTSVKNGWLIRLHRLSQGLPQGQPATPDDVYVSYDLTEAMDYISDLTDGVTALAEKTAILLMPLPPEERAARMAAFKATVENADNPTDSA